MAATPVEFGVLGSLEVRLAGAPADMRGARPRTALAALLVHAPHPVSADALVTAIWGEDLPVRPRGALQTVISRVRTVLGAEVLRAEPGGYRLEIPDGAVDADRFASLLHRADGLPPPAAAEMLDAALALWRGPAYAEFADQDFARAETTRLEELRQKATEERALLALDLEDSGHAVVLLRQLVLEQPLRESAHGLLMTALYRAGRATEALDQFQLLRRHLAEELGLDPSPTLRDLQGRILDHSLSTAARAVPAAPGRRMPPAWRPSADLFIGREDATAALLRAATAHPLVCVTGPGGVGKSRLVIEALPELSRRLARPAAVAELEDAAPGDVAGRVADALGLGIPTGPGTAAQNDAAGPHGAAGPREAVLEYLSATSLILVLDACEQVRVPVRHLAEEILRVAPRVHLVLTSRQGLGLGAAQDLPLPPLALPDPAAAPERAALAPAMRLFVERLRRLRPTADLDRPTLLDAGELCRRLDGLPLALELAATQSAVLGVGSVLESFGAGLQLGDDRVGSLEAVVARSVELLTTEDRTLLGRLSAFTGTFGLDDAEAVARDAPARAGLSRLVQASLVDPVGEEPEPRFRLLGIVGAFAADRADDRAAGAYWRWAAESSARWARQATGAEAAAVLARMSLARADLTAAASAALTTGRLDLAARTVGHLGLCVHWVPGPALAEVTLRVGEHPDLAGTAAESLARGAAALAAVERGEVDRAVRLGRAARRVAVGPEECFLAAVSLAIAAVYAGRRETAARHWLDVLAIEGLADARRVDGHSALALVRAAAGRIPEAEEHAAAARRAAERSGAAPREAFALYASGEVLLTTDLGAAAEVLAESARLADVAGAEQVAAVARVALLSALTRTGRVADALALSLTLLELQQRRGHWPQLWTTMRILAELFTVAGRFEAAELVLAAAETAPSAPGLAGADITRYRVLRADLREGLGGTLADRIAAVARLLPRTEILARTRETAASL